MALDTKIQWTNHTINFFTGCTKVSAGCKYCYMYRDQERYGKDPKEVVRVKDSTINKHLKNAKAGDKIFVNSWSDFFIEEADDYRSECWDIIRSRPDLIWQILTKRPERIVDNLPEDWGEGWDNVWLGVSVENQAMANERIIQLCRVPSKIRFLSIEPLIGSVDFYKASASWEDENHPWRGEPILHGIHWVIIGGESGNDVGKYRYRPAELSWFESIINDCVMNDVAVFVKQTGTYLAKRHSLSDRHGGNIEDFPESMRLRQFPNGS